MLIYYPNGRFYLERADVYSKDLSGCNPLVRVASFVVMVRRRWEDEVAE